MNSENFRSGFVGIDRSPECGKIHASKSSRRRKDRRCLQQTANHTPQDQRHRNVPTTGQIVFVDTPGVHKPGYLLNRRMMAAVHDAILSVDLIVLMRDAFVSTGNGDRFVLDLVKKSEKAGNFSSQQN